MRVDWKVEPMVDVKVLDSVDLSAEKLVGMKVD